MSIYELHHGISLPEDPPVFDLRLVERDIYGSSRVGTETVNQTIASGNPSHVNIDISYTRTVGDKRYELSNLPIAIGIGNVLQVVTDRKLQIETTIGSGVLDYYSADVVSQSDYFPFGMVYSNTDFYVDLVTGEDVAIVSDNDYRYSFQGQEKDDEIKGEGNSVNYKYRMHDPRVGRFFAVDPLAPQYPHNGPYNFSENRLIDGVELEGREVDLINENGELTPGPWSNDYVENGASGTYGPMPENSSGTGVKDLTEITTNKMITNAIINLYYSSPTFKAVFIAAKLNENDVSITPGPHTGVTPTYEFKDGKESLLTTNISIRLTRIVGDTESKLSWEFTNLTNTLQYDFRNLENSLKVGFIDTDEFAEGMIALESEAAFNRHMSALEMGANYVYDDEALNEKYGSMDATEFENNKDQFMKDYTGSIMNSDGGVDDAGKKGESVYETYKSMGEEIIKE